jgi:hypothetical protein
MRKMKNIITTVVTFLIIVALPILSANPVAALSLPVSNFAESQCGSQGDAIKTSINFGCYGAACLTQSSSKYCSKPHNAVVDLLFAIIRFITDGVGLIIIASLVYAGIQYTLSRGNPQELAKANKRIQSTVMALVLFIFAYALLNYVIPNGFFGQ